MRRSVVALVAGVVAIGAAAGIVTALRHGERPLEVVSEATTPTAGPAPPALLPPTFTTVTSHSAPSPAADLQAGATGPDVVRLQQRLVELGFWLGSPDGVFSTATAHAVVAFQKLAGLVPDGIVGATTKAALDTATRPRPRSAEGHSLEVDLTHQVLIVADAGTAMAVLDISTGRIAGTTPVGRFTVTRQVDGYHHAPLGVLYRPKYFYRGVALHGYPSVPPYPASHGCVRTINPAMDWLWSSGAAPIGTVVSVYR